MLLLTLSQTEFSQSHYESTEVRQLIAFDHTD
jgi:hypothetical protein